MTLDRTDILPGKGTSRCNRTACQVLLPEDGIWYNRSTDANYCRVCARKINDAAGQALCTLVTLHEGA